MEADKTLGVPNRLAFASVDGRYRLTVPENCTEAMLAHARASVPKETGGIIVGQYTEALDHAVLTDALGPPADSRGWATGFIRGVQGLARALRNLWSSSVTTYYLGEWHFHPFSAAQPSEDDADQMFSIAHNDRYRCPEPILLILGGDPAGVWEVSAHVYTRAGEHLILAPPAKQQEGRGGCVC